MVGRKQKGYLRWILAGAIIAVAIAAISMLNFGDNLVYFYTPSEAFAKANDLGNQTIKIGAMVKPGSLSWDSQKLDLAFTITDLKDHEIRVLHHGPAPDLFKEGQGVVVEGRLGDSGKTFVAQNLMVKHSEEYKRPDDHGSMDKVLLERSLFKGENEKR